MKKTTSYRKNQGSLNLFEQETTMQSLSEIGNPLEFIGSIVDFEIFRPTLESHLMNEERKSNAGRRPIDPVLMFKIMFLQRLYGLSDEQTEYQIKDRTSFREFLDILTVTDVPDARTIWKYKEALSQNGGYDALFKDFYGHLSTLGLIVHEGKMIDASFVVAPRQRNTREENAKIKEGNGGELWNDQPNKKSHKDVDARWTKKRNETFFGYKNHAKVCVKTKLITGYDTTDASVHDSKRASELVDDNDVTGETFWLDAGYVGTEDGFVEKQIQPLICEKGYRNHPLTDVQKASNRDKSKTRSRVEHVFGFIERSMGGLVFRSVGIIRARACVALTNLTYNIARLAQIFRYHADWIKTPDAASVV